MSYNSNYLSTFTSTNTSNTDILSMINYVNYSSVTAGSTSGNVGYFDLGNTRIIYSNGHIITNSSGEAWVNIPVGFGNVPTGVCNCYSIGYFYRIQALNYTSTTCSIQCVVNSGTSGILFNFVIFGLKP